MNSMPNQDNCEKITFHMLVNVALPILSQLKFFLFVLFIKPINVERAIIVLFIYKFTNRLVYPNFQTR